MILNARTGVLDLETEAPGALDELSAEVYGADLLNFVDGGLKLKRFLIDAGDHEVASSVTAALVALQNLIGLPGPPQQFLTFLADNYKGYELQSLGTRFDHLTPRGLPILIFSGYKKGCTENTSFPNGTSAALSGCFRAALLLKTQGFPYG